MKSKYLPFIIGLVSLLAFGVANAQVTNPNYWRPIGGILTPIQTSTYPGVNLGPNAVCSAGQVLKGSATGTPYCVTDQVGAGATTTIFATATATGPAFTFTASGTMISVSCSGSTCTFTGSSSSLALASAAYQTAAFFLQSAQNLADVASTTAARANLGLGTAALQAATDFLASSTIFVSSTNGNWAGTWQGVNSSTFYLASNPAGYITTSTPEAVSQSSTLHIEGDSICREVLGGVSGTYKEWYEYITIPDYHNDSWNRTTHCVGGTKMSTMYANRATYIDPNLINGGNNILVIAGQGNDLYFGDSTSTFEATALAFGQAEKAAGWTVVLVNMFDREDGTVTRAQIDDYNTWTRKTWPQFADVLVDLGNDPILGPSGASHNTTYFDTDKIHLTDRGLAYYAKQVQAGILKAQNKLALGSMLASTTMGTTTFPNLTPNSFAFIGPGGQLTTTSTPTGSSSTTSVSSTVNLTGSSSIGYFPNWLDVNGLLSATSVIYTNSASVGASTTVSTTQTFSYTGAMASFTLPSTVTGSVTFYVQGGHGGKGASGDDGTSVGGYGGSATGTLSAASSTPGLVLWIAVGGMGTQGGSSTTSTGAWPGGGDGSAAGGANAPGLNGGGGGGLSGIFNTSTIASSTAYIVAGGGGGGTCYGNNQGFGDGGGLTGGHGSNGSHTVGGSGGTQSAGGAGGTNDTFPGTAGSFGATGTSMTGGHGGPTQTSGCGGGGGGAGYWGGGGASSFNNGASGGGAGGGSSFMLSSLTATSSASSTANTATGTVKITYNYVTSSAAVTATYVGIGTTSPTSTLAVSGTLSIYGLTTLLGQLTVTANSILQALTFTNATGTGNLQVATLNTTGAISASGTANFAAHVLNSGAAPTVACATGGSSIASTSTDMFGKIVNTSSTASCTVSFNVKWTVPPVCIASANSGTIQAFKAEETTSTVVITGAAAMATGSITDYICSGHP